MSKGDYISGTSISFDVLIRGWKYVLYGLLFNMIILKHTNPLFKIILATYVGIESILGIFYAPIIYYKRNKENEGSQDTGIIPKITGFIPNMLYKFSVILIKLSLKVLKIKESPRSVDVESCASTITYCFIYFRKIIALACGILITHEDDESSHIKALTIYAICSWIQMKFVGNTDNNSISKVVKDPNASFYQCLQRVLQPNMSKRERPSYDSLKKFRKVIFYLTALLVILFIFYTYEHVSESLDTKFIWTMLLKGLILLDSIFTCSFILELGGLDMMFVNRKNTVV